MNRFRIYTEEEIKRIDKLQAEFFSECMHIFDPPLPEGVPARLEKIVESAKIESSDSVLDVGTGTGILIPIIQKYAPACIYANDLSQAMLDSVKSRYPSVRRACGDVRDLSLPDGSIGIVLLNACYPNIIDKHNSFTNIQRMLRPGGRVIISHPLGRSFVETLKPRVPFPLDDFPPEEGDAEKLFAPYGFGVTLFINGNRLYILRLESTGKEPVNLEKPRSSV